jgi:hypothetical protein
MLLDAGEAMPLSGKVLPFCHLGAPGGDEDLGVMGRKRSDNLTVRATGR